MLCLMLIGDETFNVRMGLFAPQWSRAGIGYTIMLCVLFFACLILSLKSQPGHLRAQFFTVVWN